MPGMREEVNAWVKRNNFSMATPNKPKKKKAVRKNERVSNYERSGRNSGRTSGNNKPVLQTK